MKPFLLYFSVLLLLVVFTVECSSQSSQGDNNAETECLLHSSPSLDAKYCTDQLRSFESRLNGILDKIEEKTENFDFQRGCQRGWYNFNGYCYYYSKEKKSWNEAREWCEIEGNSDLISILDDTERDFVIDKLDNQVPDDDGAVHFWIGLHDKDSEGHYKWSSGIPLHTTYWKTDNFKYVLDASSRAIVTHTLPDMYAVTACFWMKSSSTNAGTPFSYSTTHTDNEFLMLNYNAVTINVLTSWTGNTGVDLADGSWRHVCVTWSSSNGKWQLFKDTQLAAQGTGLRNGQHMRSEGILILGQEQDAFGGGLDANQAFIGEMSLFNMWDRVLSMDEIISNFADCIGDGNVYSWYSNNISPESVTIAPFQYRCGQPNDYFGQQDCVEIMDKYGNWNDDSCGSQHRFICKTHKVPRDCADIINNGYDSSGVYRIDPDGQGSFDVYCDMESDGGGYTVFQSRMDGAMTFFREWKEYKLGFGDLNGEFWLGNDKLNRLTRGRHQELRVDLKNVLGETDFIVYDYFSVGHENDYYRLRLGAKIGGGLPDHFPYQVDMQFSTRDKDNDNNSENCALNHHGGWWYNSTRQYIDLNGEYSSIFGLSWQDWSNPRIIESEMKIK